MTDLTLYTKPAEDRMRLRHDAQVRLSVVSGRRTLEDRLCPVDTIGGAYTVACITYNRLSMSGGTDWWDPATGRSIKRPKFRMLVRPEDVLTGDQECSCSRCLEDS